MKEFDISKDYDRESFETFAVDFLPDDFECESEEVYFDFKNIEQGFKLGTCKSLDLDAFEFRTKSNRDPRVTLTKEVVSCMKKYGSNPNALAVFYAKESHSWRLSLITTDYTIEKGKIKTEHSNPRRFSFKLGKDCKRHTPTVSLIKKGKVLDIEDLKSRFAIEVVGKEFFAEYKVFYEDFVQYITGNRYLPKAKDKTEIHKANKDIFPQFLSLAEADNDKACKYARDYIKKMMGRLVFLEFLQKKGWLGVEKNGKWGSGDKSFLQNLFIQSQNKDDFLEKDLKPLFFGMLNTPEADREFVFKKNKWSAKLLSQFKKVPYLNGGLFECDSLDKLTISFPKEMFSNPPCVDEAREFAGVQKKYPYGVYCGLLDFFARYNFTIDETDPADMEIGVEPEMLGKIFENLLEDNKDKGAFYTPKEIVQYMCRESLIAYLETDSKIDGKKIRNLVELKNAEFTPQESKLLLKMLKEAKVCDPAVGSGAFPMGMLNELFACRIALGEMDEFDENVKRAEIKKQIVRQNIYGVDIEKGAVDIARLRFWLAIIVDEAEPLPLPNLDYKIMQGNSLLECYQGIDLSKMLEPPSDGEFDYNEEQRTLLKNNMDEYFDDNNHEDKTVKNEMIKSLVFELARLTCGLTQNEPKALELYDKICNGTTDFFLWHAWFNDVFSKGGFDIVIGNPPYFKYEGNHKGEIELLKKQKELRPSFGGKLNAYKLFLAKAISSLVCDNGFVCYIFQNSFLADQQACVLRKSIFENAQFISIDSFPERDNKKKRVFESVKMSVCIPLIKKTKSDLPFTVCFWDDKNKSSGFKSIFTKTQIASMDAEYYTIPRIRTNSIPLIMKMKSLDKLSLKCYEGELNMTFHKSYFSKNVSFPKILKGASIQRFFFTESMSQGEVEYLDEKRYLKDFCGDKTMHHNFERIAMQGMTGANDKVRIIMTIIPKGIYLANSCNYLLPTDKFPAKYLLGLLNSKLINWFFRCFSTNSNVNGYEIESLPVPQVSLIKQKPIISLVDKILAAKKDNPDADTSKLESQIDELVYDLYCLTEEEKEIVRGS